MYFSPMIPAASLRVACSNCGLRDLCMPMGLGLKEIETLEEIVSCRKRVRRGNALYHAGDKFEAFYAIRLGCMKSAVLSGDGREQVTNFHISGDIVGLDGLASNVYSCDLIALEDTEVCVLSYERLREVSAEMPMLSEHFDRLISREIVRQSGVLVLLGSMHAEERLAAFLLNLSQRYEQRGYSRSEFVLRMTRAEIGSFLGLKLETVSRVLSRFTHDQLLIVNQKHVQILDFDGLRAIVSGQSTSNEVPPPEEADEAPSTPSAVKTSTRKRTR